MKFNKQVRLVYIASALSIGVLVVFGLLFMEKSREQVHYIDAVEHTYKVLSTINFCEKVLIEAEAAQRGYLLTRDGDYLDLFMADLPIIDSALRAIGRVTGTKTNQTIYFSQLQKFVEARIKVLKYLDLKATDSLYSQNLRTGANIMENCKYYMQKMRSVEESQLRQELEKKNRYQRLNLSFFNVVFILSCLICVLAIAIFFREFNMRLKVQQNLRSKISELSKSKQELEEITFAASHDLQEPMRKVRILSNLMTKKFQGSLAEGELEVVTRIGRITEQMQALMNDLVLYTNLLNPREKYTAVNLNDVFRAVYYKVFKDELARVKMVSRLPTIHGSHAQVETMLTHLLENSQKFASPGRELLITVTYELKPVEGSNLVFEDLQVEQFHEITIRDNGIGFDNMYAEKIFGLFQRLHSQSDFAGKGIGLSIARRVMTNHHGFISAYSDKNVGATFILSFPAA